MPLQITRHRRLCPQLQTRLETQWLERVDSGVLPRNRAGVSISECRICRRPTPRRRYSQQSHQTQSNSGRTKTREYSRTPLPRSSSQSNSKLQQRQGLRNRHKGQLYRRTRQSLVLTARENRAPQLDSN